MRIAVGARSYAPEIGGVQTVAALLANEWAANGHDVSVITETPGPPRGAEAIRRVNSCDRAASREILTRADGIVWHDPMLKELPLLVRNTGRLLVVFHRRAQRENGKRAPQDLLKCCLGLVFRSVAVSRALAGQYAGAKTVIPPPLDPTISRCVTSHASWQNRNEDCLYLGRLVPGKGLKTLINAIGWLRDGGRSCRLVIAGEGPCLSSLGHEVQRRELQNEVSFTGPIQRQEVAEFLQKFKVVVMASEYFEGFGMAVVEGIACGCIPVATECGGLREAVGSCGILVPPRSPEKLAAALVSALDDREVKSRVAAGAPEHVASLELRKVAARYIEMIQFARAAVKTRRVSK